MARKKERDRLSRLIFGCVLWKNMYHSYMQILFKYQIFQVFQYGGISRYFAGLVCAFQGFTLTINQKVHFISFTSGYFQWQKL